MRAMKFAVAAMFAVCAVSAMAAGSASAFHPLFLTVSKKELLFSGSGGVSTLRAKETNLPATEGSVTCNKSIIHGFALNLSTLAHRIRIEFSGDCLELVGVVKTKCNEPITTKLILAELGLLSATNHLVVTLLIPSDGTSEFAEVVCETNITKVSGSIVGVIPAINGKLEEQINAAPNEVEVVFEAHKSVSQSVQEIWLLGTQMTGDHLVVSGFLGGEASEEGSGVLKSDATKGIEISTTKE